MVKLAAIAIQCLDLFIRAIIKAEVYVCGRGKKSGGRRKEQSKIQECLLRMKLIEENHIHLTMHKPISIVEICHFPKVRRAVRKSNRSSANKNKCITFFEEVDIILID